MDKQQMIGERLSLLLVDGEKAKRHIKPWAKNINISSGGNLTLRNTWNEYNRKKVVIKTFNSLKINTEYLKKFVMAS